MQFVVIIYHGTSPLPGSPAWDALTEDDRQSIYAAYGELNQDTGITLRLPPIKPSEATTVTLKDGAVQVKDAPYLDEGIGGAFVLEADNREGAIALAARIPQAARGGAVEIRTVEQYF